jgi:cell division protein FtsB
MIQESIVDYINAQMKLGVSRDAVKATLTGAGWVAVDVEDTFKKIDSAKMAQPISAMPSASPVTKPTEPAIASKPMTPVGMATNPGPQTIKVSDLVSSAAAPVVMTTKPVATRSPLTGPAAPMGTKSPNSYQASAYHGAKPHESRSALVIDIVLIVVIIAVGAFAGFLYVQNKNLNTQLSSLNGQSSGVTSQLSALQAEVAASTTALTAQVSSLDSEIQDLQTELAFYAAPSGTTPGATSTVTVSGIVSGGGKLSYAITAMYGAKIYVANSKVASVISALVPLMATVGTTSTPATPAITAQFSGTYVPGSDSITLTAVNGAAIQ